MRWDVVRAKTRLDSGMEMGTDIWCRAVSFHLENGSAGDELNELYTRNKMVRQRRRINAGQTSVTMYTYGLREGAYPRAMLPRGEPGCVNPLNIRTYASTSTDEPSPADPRGLIFRADIH